MDASHTGRAVIKQEIKGLQALAQRIDVRFEAAVELLDVPGKVIVTGVGKSGHVARKLAATMTSLGSPAIFVHPTEAAHGDLGLLGTGDAVLALSRSGKAVELGDLLMAAVEFPVPVVLITELSVSMGLTTYADVILKLPKVKEAWGDAPTTSTTMQMALGDALAVALAERRGFMTSDFRRTHPGGHV